jgi:hypothetical protein
MYTSRVVEKNKHGTRQMYNDGCRCALCRSAWAAYFREYRRSQGRRSRATELRDRDLHHTRAAVERAVSNEHDVQMPVKLTALGGQILLAKQQRTGKSRSEIIEELLRAHPTDATVTE